MKPFELGSKKIAPGSDPRADERRKESKASFDGPDRRQGADRRGLKYGLKFKTSSAVGPIEDWLNDNFPGESHLAISGMSDDFAVKEIQVSFASADDRQNFKDFLSDYLNSR